MRKRRAAKHPTLEGELKCLASERIKKDSRGRTRAELLAATLWNKSLSGDRDSLRMLLERLPVAVPQPDEPTTAESTASNVATFEQVTRALRSLVEAGIMPAEAFERYRIKKLDEEFESKNGDWNKTMQ